MNAEAEATIKATTVRYPGGLGDEDLREECGNCGGSGGGPDVALRCPDCRGTGTSREWADRPLEDREG